MPRFYDEKRCGYNLRETLPVWCIMIQKKLEHLYYMIVDLKLDIFDHLPWKRWEMVFQRNRNILVNGSIW
jgi:hypothetical protein|uniref:Uncharacterized protein n=1 Tax=viral metagenome TaxID=1070528 RepID=A0A6C0BHP0_9ZZZZ